MSVHILIAYPIYIFDVMCFIYFLFVTKAVFKLIQKSLLISIFHPSLQCMTDLWYRAYNTIDCSIVILGTWDTDVDWSAVRKACTRMAYRRQNEFTYYKEKIDICCFVNESEFNCGKPICDSFVEDKSELSIFWSWKLAVNM